MLKYCSTDIVFQEIPDETTLAVNITGCPNRCPGCHSPWLWNDEGMRLDKTALTQMIENCLGEITCICFMGGDAEPGEVEALSKYIREKYPCLLTAWYSGADTMPEGVQARSFNYVKLGRYIPSAGGLRSPGTNQRMYKIRPDGEMQDITALFHKHT